MFDFDKSYLEGVLSEPGLAHVMFSWRCAKRLEPYYAWYEAEQNLTNGHSATDALKAVSQQWIDGQKKLSFLEDVKLGLEQQIGTEPHRYEPGQMAWEDCMWATIHCVNAFITEDAGQSALVGKILFDSAYRFSMHELKIDPNDKNGIAELVSTPTVQTELKRQRRDVAELRLLRSKRQRKAFPDLHGHERLLESKVFLN